MSAFTTATFREVLGHFATGITVITGSTSSGPAGFTCQSFSSLSLDPPLVLILPSRKSVSWPEIAESGRFCVNVLSEQQRSVSNGFAQSGSDKFAGISWGTSPSGLPVIDGSSAWIECSIESTYPGGDHIIVVGNVQHLDHSVDRIDPLIFHRGNYVAHRPLDAEIDERPCERMVAGQMRSEGALS